MKRFFISMVIVLFSVINGYSAGADVAKIAVVDFKKIFVVSEAGKASQIEISAKHKELNKVLTDKKTEIDELQKNIERGELVLSKEQKEEKKRDLNIKVYDLQRLEKKYSAELNELNKIHTNKMTKTILKVVQELGKNESYLLVLEKGASGVIYFPDHIDITEDVIKLVNKK